MSLKTEMDKVDVDFRASSPPLRFVDRSLSPNFVAVEQVETGAANAAQDAARKAAETHADAVRVVIRAKAREGHDLAAIRPADALAVDIVRRALDDVRGCDLPKLDDVFNASSPASAIAKGSAVSRVQSQGVGHEP